MKKILFVASILFFIFQCSAKSHLPMTRTDTNKVAKATKTIKAPEQDFKKSVGDFSLTQNRVQGEYLIQTKSGKKDVIYNFLKQYKIVKVRKSNGADFFIVNIEKDPGPKIIETASKKFLDIKSIQPNFLYKGF